ncbi:uncharacterized protein LOC116341317 [Contarinia nasturtii]|uniref:uncharacterized protein LOC116341317 n=1 Tax=Contarinia nasturtii TaxID=265458 RepID=UPI0012D45E4E|nr:uncharacterized protein LOC116341317 [Contarinia nasturtii]
MNHIVPFIIVILFGKFWVTTSMKDQEKSTSIDCKNYNETVPKLMSTASWIDFVVAHAKGHFENLEWNVLKELHNQKRNAISALSKENASIEYLERMADIFTNYRKGVLDMEYFIDVKSTEFTGKLKKSLMNAKKQMEGKDKMQKIQIGKAYSDRFVNDMQEFDRMVTNEYNRIIPIIFQQQQQHSFFRPA